MIETTWSDTRIVVKTLVQERKVTMKSIGIALGVGIRKLHQILDNDPTADQLEKIADAIGVHPEDITEICRLMKLEPAYAAPSGKHQEGE